MRYVKGICVEEQSINLMKFKVAAKSPNSYKNCNILPEYKELKKKKPLMVFWHVGFAIIGITSALTYQFWEQLATKRKLTNIWSPHKWHLSHYLTFAIKIQAKKSKPGKQTTFDSATAVCCPLWWIHTFSFNSSSVRAATAQVTLWLERIMY